MREESATHALLVQLLQEQFGSQVELVSAIVVNQREDYVVLLTSLRHPSLEIVVKFAGPDASYPSPFERIAMFHRLVADHTDISMPEVLAVDVSCQKWPWRYLITTCLPGQEWAEVRSQLNQEELHHAYQQLGQAVGQLHGISFSHFGEVESDGTVPVQGDYLDVLTQRAYQRIANPRLSDIFLGVVEEHLDLFSGINTPGLCHEDMHGHNILFQQVQGRWQLSTILDFMKAWAGHQESDLARLDFWDGMVGEGFWEAYREVNSVEDGYIERRPIYQLFWCLEYAISSPKHIADTQRLCKMLGIPMIADFRG